MKNLFKGTCGKYYWKLEFMF